MKKKDGASEEIASHALKHFTERKISERIILLCQSHDISPPN